MSNGFDNFLNATGEAIKVVPELYEDVFQPAAKEVGKTLSLVPKAINAAFVPLACWIEERQYNFEETKILISQKLEHVGKEKIVTPESYVAIPAIQAISYSMNSKELRNLYANLLAKSMNIDTKNEVHPSYVEIIKQLSPFDAELLGNLNKEGRQLPIMKARFQRSAIDTIGVDFMTHIISSKFGVDYYNHDTYALSLENLCRLRLITIDYNYKISNEDLYNEISNGEIAIHIQNLDITQARPDLLHRKLSKGTLTFTPFGTGFTSICI